jgi:hypothetical protein
MTSSLTIESTSEDTVTVLFAGGRLVHDDDKLTQQWEFWPKVTSLCQQRGIRRVLIRNELVGEISSNYVRDLHLNLENFGLVRSIRYAMVVPDQRSRGVLKFGYRLASSEGWDLEIFEDLPAATAWLARPLVK